MSSTASTCSREFPDDKHIRQFGERQSVLCKQALSLVEDSETFIQSWRLTGTMLQHYPRVLFRFRGRTTFPAERWNLLLDVQHSLLSKQTEISGNLFVIMCMAV